MSKVLKTAAIVVGAVAVVVGTAGILAPAATAGALAALGVTATAAGVASTLGLVASGLSLAAGLTAKKVSAQATGSQEDFAADPDAGIPLIIGRTATAGTISFSLGNCHDRDSISGSATSSPIDYGCGILRRIRGACAAAIQGDGPQRVPYGDRLWRLC